MNNQHMHGAVQAAQADFLHKVWTDDAFAARLEDDPKAVFAEMGSQIDDDVEIRVVRDTENVKHVCIPAAPSEGEISDGDLAGAQGGATLPYLTVVTTSATMSAQVTTTNLSAVPTK